MGRYKSVCPTTTGHKVKTQKKRTLRNSKDKRRVAALRRAVQSAQVLVRRYVGAGVRLSDELIAERRAAASRE